MTELSVREFVAAKKGNFAQFIEQHLPKDIAPEASSEIAKLKVASPELFMMWWTENMSGLSIDKIFASLLQRFYLRADSFPEEVVDKFKRYVELFQELSKQA